MGWQAKLMLMRWLFGLIPFVALLLAPNAFAAASEPEVAVGATPAASTEATLEVFNRDIITFRAPALGISPQDRARRAKIRIKEQLHAPGAHKVTLQTNPLGTLVQIDGAMSFLVIADDVDKLQQESLAEAAGKAAVALTAAIDATREGRSLDAIVRAVAVSTATTLVAFALLWAMRRVRQAVERWLVRVSERHTERLRVSGVQLIHRERLAWLAHAAVVVLQSVLTAVILYEWISLVFAQFPYTRVWSERLTEFLIATVVGIGSGIAGAMPGLFVAVVIFFIARSASRLLRGFFDRVQSGQVQVSWLDPDVTMLTRRIANALLWLFALAMAYPYLPGAHTEAFKGLSVLVGLMLSLGASNLVGQAASGLILTYSHVYRHGEYVRIAEHEGTVTELGMFATRLRTGLGEELTLSNSLILGAVTRNYSRAVKGPGFVLDTVVTIGYDTPWRQVHAMLVDAALRTPGVLAEPQPRVFQTGLSDFYPEYRLVCQAIPSEPMPRAVVLSTLHANIQDVFNEYGVQIMSPHYLEDPAAPKTVPKEHWFTAPARPPES